ncbi:MAG: SDR family NAD(P)-dependent oxidoreductase [Planctomycetota bacterium]
MRLPADAVYRLRAAYQGRRVLITGGAGFIGSHLADALLDLGAHVVVIDDLSNSSLENLSERLELEPERLTFSHASILEPAALREAVAGVGVVFHLAAVGSVQRSVEDPERTLAVNVIGTARVLEAVRSAGVARCVLASSSSVYGDSATLPANERAAPAPLSPYAASKLSGEALSAAWARTYDLSTVALRYFNVFGPRQPGDSAYSAVIASFARTLLEGDAPTVFGDGEQTRDFTPVASVVLGTLLAGATEHSLRGEVINVAMGHRVSVNQLAASLAATLGRVGVAPSHTDPRPGEVRDSQADIALARELLGFQPVGSFDEALAETAEWYRRAHAAAEPR